MHTKIQSLFLLKALCALFVVIIHFPLVGKTYLDPIIKISVPIFYMITGYFMFTNLENERSRKRLLHASLKILKLILGSNVVYLAYNLFMDIPCTLTSISDIIRFIFWGDNISGHLYFLTSYFWATFLLSLLPTNQIKNICLGYHYSLLVIFYWANISLFYKIYS